MKITAQKSAHRKSPRLSPLASAIRLSLVGLTLAHATSQAATVKVTSHLDIAAEGCTLREAFGVLNDQSARPGCNIVGSFGSDDTVIFGNSILSTTFTLLEGEIDLGPDSRNILIDARNVTGGITVNGNSDSRVLFTNNVELELNNITISGGSATVGGGIFAFASTIKLTDSTMSGNTADNQGGGIYGFSSNIELISSTVSGNLADGGGGIYARDSSEILLNNSTVSENTARYGGGVYARYSSNIILGESAVAGNNGGGLRVSNSSYLRLLTTAISDNAAGATTGGGGLAVLRSSSASVSNSTISGNTAGLGGAGFLTDSSTINISNSTLSGNSATTTFSSNGGGALLARFSSKIDLINSTLSENSANTDGDGVFLNTNSSMSLSNSIIANSASGDDVYISIAFLTSDTASIIEEASYGGSRTGDPGLLPLADNGGATLTHALSENSIARDTGILTGAISGLENCTTSDQRDQLRDDADGACDVGAIEFNPDDEGAVDDDGFFVIPLGNGKTVVVPL